MSRGEILWRFRSLLRLGADRLLLSRRQRPRPLERVMQHAEAQRGFSVHDVACGEWADAKTGARENVWCGRLLARAEHIAKGDLSYFDLQRHHHGDPIDWNRDHAADIAAPLRFAPLIDYRDFRVTGDCKLVWEPNRHHHLVVLARAYRASGEIRFAEAAVTQLDGWLRQCPYGMGMNWRSPLELGVRLINWVWTIDLIRESGLVSGGFEERLIDSVDRHVWEIARSFSQGSSAGNHLVGEAAGVYVAANYFDGITHASRYREQSRALLENELLRQTFADGGGREQAFGYALFVMQFFLICMLVAEKRGHPLSDTYRGRLEAMFEFVNALCEGGNPPLFGDCDDGYVLDLGSARPDAREMLAWGASVFKREDFKQHSGADGESVRWLLGKSGLDVFDSLQDNNTARDLAPHAFPESGLYLLQYGHAKSPENASVTFDCGPHGLPPMCGHGHADALSVTLRVAGQSVLVDPGTFDYFTYPELREYFRSTAAHNTLEIDALDQSEMLGAFLWGRAANAKLLSWRPTSDGGSVSGEHDGYDRLADPVTHRRTVTLAGETGLLTIRDELDAMDSHQVEFRLHFAEHCRVRTSPSNVLRVCLADVELSLELDARLAVESVSAADDGHAGWISPAYHVKRRGATVIGRATLNGDVVLTTTVRLPWFAKHVAFKRLENGGLAPAVTAKASPDAVRHGPDGTHQRALSSKMFSGRQGQGKRP